MIEISVNGERFSADATTLQALLLTRGYKLETTFLGNRLMTSRQAAARFLAAINGGPPTSAQIETTSSAENAGMELDALLK